MEFLRSSVERADRRQGRCRTPAAPIGSDELHSDGFEATLGSVPEGDALMPTPSKRPDAIVLVHGFWVTPRSWEHWIPRYEAQGYRVLAPGYPGFEVEVEALNRDPSPVERLTVPAIMAHLEAVVERVE